MGLTALGPLGSPQTKTMWKVVAISVLAVIAHAEADEKADVQSAKDWIANWRSKEAAAMSAKFNVAELTYMAANSMENTDEFRDKLVNSLVEAEPNIQNAIPQIIQSELDRDADRGTAYEWIKYNSEVDPRLAMEAEAAVAIMKERARLKALGKVFHNAQNPSSSTEELVQTPTQSISLAPLALMALFMCSVLALAARHWQSKAYSTEYIAINS